MVSGSESCRTTNWLQSEGNGWCVCVKDLGNYDLMSFELHEIGYVILETCVVSYLRNKNQQNAYILR